MQNFCEERFQGQVLIWGSTPPMGPRLLLRPSYRLSALDSQDNLSGTRGVIGASEATLADIEERK
ncbi:hypothetical protein CABS01_17001 [Colletotrichum abscissum]|uniref:uncharacterized protein n=1 Tax=Colletotrichum abscissum TaxID=1671311 RepID=UPI0027D6FF11|nr:uncharacterized protein CABS01_17001 [Colletotrichum abscissum]KAK1500222.1 hypothetical protein CABS01_17001 [Colletotrichum abscissum]